MKRPMLVSGTAIGLSTAFLVLSGIGALPFMLLGAVSVFVVYFIKTFKLKEKIAIPTICISVILACIFFGAFHFTKIAPSKELHNTTLDISGKIITTPQETAYGTKFILKSDRVGNKEHSTKIQVYLNSDYETDFKLYDYVSLSDVSLEIIKNDYNKPDADSMSDGIILEAQANDLDKLWECEKTPYYYCLRLKEIVTKQINSYLDDLHAGLLLGMLFGDKSSLDSDIKNDFRATGIAHLLAVSGLHTSTWCGYIIILLKLLRVREKQRNIFCLFFLALLCIVSAFTPSVMRASIMMSVVLLAPFFNEEQDALNSLGFAMGILVLNNPYVITSPSFLLSFFATFGILTSINITAKAEGKLLKIKLKPLRKIFEYISSSLLTSVFAGIFTLPVSAYFFGVFSILSPITNIICVKPAFWSLLSGVLASAISFIPNNITHNLAIYLFDITQLLSDFVITTADKLESFSFCTIPTHKEYFICGLISVTLISFLSFLIYTKKKNKTIIKLSAVISAIFMSLSIILPCTTLTPATLSVINVENGVNVSIRHGLKYAYLNCGASSDAIPYDFVPSAKCESLDFLFIGNADEATNELTKALLTHSPKTTVVTSVSKGDLNESSIYLRDNTIISDSYSYNFNAESTIQTVDTYPVGCVIINWYEKTVAINYGSNSDLDLIFKSYGIPDILVLSGAIPEALPENVDTLIISSDSDVIINKNISELKIQCNKFYTTAENGDIKLIL